MGRKCSVENCLSDSSRSQDQGVTFHKIPHHTDLRPKWLSLCRIPEDKKILHVCSRHFLRADFCNFKGKKYMLRQGVLPSVFPWDKSKLEALKAEAHTKKEPEPVQIKKETKTKQIAEKKPQEPLQVADMLLDVPIKTELKEEMLDLPEAPSESNLKCTSFNLNSKIEVLDNNNIWYPAKIIEVDNEENEVLIHFERFSSKFDEWISMNSSRLRPLQPIEQYSIGEKCLASWSDSRKFPATITKVVEADTYEVLFDDGYIKTLKAHRISKVKGSSIQSSPLFEPIKSTKQERREKKRKINVAALFRKKPRLSNVTTPSKSRPSTSSAGSNTPNEETVMSPTHEYLPSDGGNEKSDIIQWHPKWLNGKPVGIESTIEAHDGIRKSIIVDDPRIPPGWAKHLTQRLSGFSAGKWDTIIMGPDNRKFRGRPEIKQYLLSHPDLGLDYRLFDFSLYRNKVTSSVKKLSNKGQKKPREKKVFEAIKKPEEALPSPQPDIKMEDIDIKQEEPEDLQPGLKIIFEDNAYKCPIEGCGKNFRRENLALMHVKHYHPEFTKFLDSTPNVADLAYARTVGENLERSPGPPKASFGKPDRMSTPKTSRLPQSPLVETPEAVTSSPSYPSKTKDTEIIKLLNQKPFDKKEDDIQPLPSGLPSNMYPDINLKDLLTNTEDIPKREEINLKTLCGSRPTMGIKTLLPVVRQPPSEPLVEETKGHQGQKRKRGVLEPTEVVKGSKDTPLLSTSLTQPSPLPTQPPPQSQPPVASALPPLSPPPSPSTASSAETQLVANSSFDNVIIEGGKIIKLERMKQEEIINCTCGFPEEDGLMIQCELCLCWQHAYCNNIQRECDVPDKYVCYICQHPLRERSSMKYKHDQDWLKQGILPTGSYHSKDNEVLQKRFEKMKKCHDLSGGLLELREYMHTLAYKLKVAEDKNHPKLYLWSKPWDKPMLPEKLDVKIDKDATIVPKLEVEDHQYIKNEIDVDKHEPQNDTMLMMMLKAGKDEKLDLESLMQNNLAPIIPRPEAAIKPEDCRLNLLEHIAHSEALVDERLDDFEKQLDALEEGLNMESEMDYPKMRQTLQMLMRDLGTLKEFSEVPTL